MLHQLVERKYESVSSIWTGCHSVLVIFATVLSMACLIFFHLVMAAFDMYCVLNPKHIVFISNASHDVDSANLVYKQTNLPIDFLQSQWASDDECFAPLYNPLMSVIFGSVWIIFFLMCSNSCRSISGLVQPWRIVMPSSIFCFVYSIVCLVITNNLSTGLGNLIIELKNVTRAESTQYSRELTKINSFILVSIVTSWLYTLCWVLSFVLLISRCIFMPDFKIMKVKLELVKNNPVDNSTNTLSSILEDNTSDIPMVKDDVQECMLIQVDVEPPKITSNVRFQPLEINSS